MTHSPVPDIFRQQAGQCAKMGSPFMAQLLGVIADNLVPEGAVMTRLLNWQGDPRGRADSVPLRLAGALHALLLQGADDGLSHAYPPSSVSDEALWHAVSQALKTHETQILAWLDYPPQTNEVRRSAALIPAALLISDRFGLPLTLSELGASGGLNLHFDQFALKIGQTRFGATEPALTLSPEWTGPLPVTSNLRVREKRGVDLNPLTGAEDELRLQAYLWPDQPERMALTKAALTCGPRPVDASDVLPWLEDRLRGNMSGTCHLIYHTVAWQYFPMDTQRECTRLIEAAGDRATAEAPLAWLGMEVDELDEPGAALTLRLWPGDIKMTLGRADFHGRWVRWDPKEQ